MIVAVTVASCVTPTPVKRPVEPEPTPTPEVEQPEQAPTPSALAILRDEGVLRYSFTALAQLGERSEDGALGIDLGTVAARKHTNGGWKDGWVMDAKRDGDTTYLEASKRDARLFFTPPAGEFAAVTVRMRLVERAADVHFMINGERVHTERVDRTWQAVRFEVPTALQQAGENELKIRFTRVPRVDRRRQSGHVDWISVLPKGVTELAQGSAYPVVTEAGPEGQTQESLVASGTAAQIYRLHVPGPAPKLGLSFAGAVGAKVQVTVASDTVDSGAVATVLEGAVEDASVWSEAVLDLAPYAGHVVEIRLASQGASVLWGEPALYTGVVQDDAILPPAEAKPAKHLLIFLIDTLRYDVFNTYVDDGVDQSPMLDAFAKDAFVFDAAYDTANWTKPSVATLLTGLYPSSHGTRMPIDHLPKDLLVLPEHLQAQGFLTTSFVGNAYITPAYGFGRGWTRHKNYVKELPVYGRANYVVRDTINWIDANKDKDKRMFMYVHIIDPHAPYSADHKFRKFWEGPKYDGKIKPYLTDRTMNYVQAGKYFVTDEDKRFVQSLYDAEVYFTDHHFEKLRQALVDRGLYDDTAILVLTDHGEEFWDHGRGGHGHSPYEELLHSPMFLRHPGSVPRGRRTPHPVSIVDMVPTLCEVLGVPSMEGAEGNSVTPLFGGASAPRPQVALSQGQSRFMSLRASRYTLITYESKRKLFDVVADRTQQKDLIDEHPIGLAYTRALTGLILGAPDKERWWDSDEGRASRPAAVAEPAQVDDETRKQLEALGYIDHDMEDLSEEDGKDDDDADSEQ